MSERELEEISVFSECLFDGKVLHLYRDKVRLPSGAESEREYCRHIGAVCIIPLLSDGRVVMERQFRFAHGRVFFEIPAGKLDFRDEDPLSAAMRELKEETGAVAGKITYLGRVDTTPALIDEKIYMYLAEELEFGERELDEDEFLDVELCHLSELYRMVMAGEIADAKTQIAVLKTAALRPHLIKQ